MNFRHKFYSQNLQSFFHSIYCFNYLHYAKNKTLKLACGLYMADTKKKKKKTKKKKKKKGRLLATAYSDLYLF